VRCVLKGGGKYHRGVLVGDLMSQGDRYRGEKKQKKLGKNVNQKGLGGMERQFKGGGTKRKRHIERQFGGISDGLGEKTRSKAVTKPFLKGGPGIWEKKKIRT